MYYGRRPYIIDIEASGFGAESYPIEIGVALREGERFCTLISPAPDWTYWDERAEAVHQVSREILSAHGKPIPEVARLLNQRLRGMILFSDGWVVDQSWLSRLFEAAAQEMNFLVSPLDMILNEEQMAIWHQTKDEVMREMNLKRHRASNDAWIIQETFSRTVGIRKDSV